MSTEKETQDPPNTATENEPDPFLAQTMKDLGLLLKDGELQPAEPDASNKADKNGEEVAAYPLVTLGEAAGRRANEALEEAAVETVKPKPDDKPVEAVDAPKSIVVKKPSVEAMVKETVDRVMADKAPPKPKEDPKPEVKPPASTSNPDADYEASLGEDERADIEFARVAEAKMPEKYKDLSKKHVAFYRKLDAYVEAGKKQNEDRTFDESDREFMDFIRENKPRMNPHDQMKVVRMQAAEDATKASDERLSKFKDEAATKQRIVDSRPLIERAASSVKEALESAFNDPRKPEEIAANEADPRTEEQHIAASVVSRAKEVGWDGAVKEDPIHGAIVKGVIDTTARRAAEFTAMTQGVSQFQPTNPDHAWLAGFLEHQTRVLQSLGPKAMQRQSENGTFQTFIPRDQFIAAMQSDPSTAQKHWTFDDGQVLAMIQNNSEQDIPRMLKTERERLTAAGYELKKKPAKNGELPKAVITEPVKASPKARPSISPGSSHNNGSIKESSIFTDREKELLGIGQL